MKNIYKSNTQFEDRTQTHEIAVQYKNNQK